jgi:outer membrane lipoprotein-sorting protein
MSTDTTTSRSRLAWAVPGAAVLVVAAAVTLPMAAGASPALPHRSPAQLLVDVQKAAGTPLSGTVVETARLGLPALPDVGGTAISPTSLVAGSHTARVWFDGADKARVALVGNLAETDLIRNGTDVWLWTSGQNTAQHAVLPATQAGQNEAMVPGTAESLTPQQAAQQALAAIDPTTAVTVDGTASVAGRDAYELVLTPRDTRSLVGDVRLAVDSKTGVPLRVQVNAKGATGRPAFETAFTSVTFAKPSAGVFRFSPPPGAKVSQLGTPKKPGGTAEAGTSGQDHRVIGKGWTAVVEMTGVSLPSAPSASGSDGRDEANQGQLSALPFTKAMTPVSGAFGHGQVLRTTLVSALLLDDGRLLVGAVPPQVLEQAAVAP